MAQQPYASQHQQGQRVRRSSVEFDPATAAAALYQEALAAGINAANPLGTFLKQQHAASMGSVGLLPPSAGLPGTMGLSGLQNGFDSVTALEAEEDPGPLPVLPRAGRAPGASAAYGFSGAPGPGLGRQPKPRRHSVTIGYLNQQQQQTALYEGHVPGSAASAFLGGQPMVPTAAGAGHSPLLPQHASANKPLQVMSQQALQAAQLSSLVSQRGLELHGQPLGGSSPAYVPGFLEGLQQQQQHPHQLPGQQVGVPQPGMSCATNNGTYLPAYGLDAPRMPSAGGSRRHSWAPVSSASAAAFRNYLSQQQQQQQQQQVLTSLAAQLGDAGALFLSSQQNEQLGLGMLGMGPGSSSSSFNKDHGGLGDIASLQNGARCDMAGPLGHGSLAAAVPRSVLPLFDDTLAKEQLAAHLQQQLAQLQQQQQQQQQMALAGRLPGVAGSILDPYAEPFVSQASLAQPVGGLPAALKSIDINSFGGGALLSGSSATALQQDLLQQVSSGLGLGFGDLPSMYAPLNVNGVSVDTQLLVSPYADNWDVLGAPPLPNGMPAASLGMPSVTVPLALPAPPAVYRQKSLQSSGSTKNLQSHGSAGSSSSSSALSPAMPAVLVSSSNSSKGSSAPAAAPAAAAAAASMVASLPPLSKVCSDVPWDLRKAVDDDAKVLAAQQQQLLQLMAVLEHSHTLQVVHAAEAAAEAASAASAQEGVAGKASADSAQALFGYQLPDSGSDTWGGSSLPASGAVAGGNCISQEPSNKLFVGNIGWWVTEDDLLHWFSRFGSVINVKIMYNSRKMHKPKDKWRSREYGFIDYATPEEAAKAIVWMDGVELPDLMKDTCGIIVQYAKPTSSTQQGSG